MKEILNITKFTEWSPLKDEEYKKKEKNMKHIKEFENKVFEDDEYDDDFEGAMGSYHMRQLKAFQKRLDKVTTVEELEELERDVEDFERYDIEDIESEWEDFRVYLRRKRASMLLREFDTIPVKRLMDLLRKLKTKADLDELLAILQLVQMMPDNKVQEELKEFVDILNDNENAHRIKKEG